MHGGDIYRNQVNLDFSVNINPLGAPEEVRDAIMRSLNFLSAYPDPKCEALRKAIARRFSWSEERILSFT